jgi:hypothetical protein
MRGRPGSTRTVRSPDKVAHGTPVGVVRGSFIVEEEVINRSESRLIALELRNQAARAMQRGANPASAPELHPVEVATPLPTTTATQLPSSPPGRGEDAANESADVRKAG